MMSRYSLAELTQQSLPNEKIAEITLMQIKYEGMSPQQRYDCVQAEAKIAIAEASKYEGMTPQQRYDCVQAEAEASKYEGMSPQQRLEFNDKGPNHILFSSFLISNSR